MKDTIHEKWLRRSIELGLEGMNKNSGGPFGAVIVRDDSLIAEAHNQVLEAKDPSAHAEIQAIRKACSALNTHQLSDCILYTSCEPCPMCLGAIYWARPKAVYFAADRMDAADGGFDDDFIYKEMRVSPESRRIPFLRVESVSQIASQSFVAWSEKSDRGSY